MLRELAHFARNAPAMIKLQKQHSRADFSDIVSTRVDEQGFADLRRELVRGVHGKVLEVGCGTGAMFGYYPPELEVEAIEPDAEFRELAVAKARERHPNVSVSDGDAGRLRFGDASFDFVVICLVLCSVPAVEQALREVHRVLRPNGHLRVLEHVCSSSRFGSLLMHAANPLWLSLNKQGCNMNRRPARLITAAGFEIESVRDFQTFDTWMPAFPMQRIDAHRLDPRPV